MRNFAATMIIATIIFSLLSNFSKSSNNTSDTWVALYPISIWFQQKNINDGRHIFRRFSYEDRKLRNHILIYCDEKGKIFLEVYPPTILAAKLAQSVTSGGEMIEVSFFYGSNDLKEFSTNAHVDELSAYIEISKEYVKKYLDIIGSPYWAFDFKKNGIKYMINKSIVDDSVKEKWIEYFELVGENGQFKKSTKKTILEACVE